MPKEKVQEVNWDTLQEFMDGIKPPLDQEEWDDLFKVAEGMEDATQALAVEHLYLHHP